MGNVLDSCFGAAPDEVPPPLETPQEIVSQIPVYNFKEHFSSDVLKKYAMDVICCRRSGEGGQQRLPLNGSKR